MNIEERKQKFMEEFTAGLSPEILQNPAFINLVEIYLAPLVYTEGDYTWGYGLDDSQEPIVTPRFRSDATVKVSEDGRTITVVRNASPLTVPGSNYTAQQAHIEEVRMNDDGTLSFTSSFGYYAPTNDQDKENFHLYCDAHQFDKDGSETLNAHFSSSVHVDRRMVNDVVVSTQNYRPTFTNHSIEENQLSFSGNLDRAFVVSRSMSNPADVSVLTVSPMSLTSTSRRIDSTMYGTRAFGIAGFDKQHPEQIPNQIVQAAASRNINLDSPYVIDRSFNSRVSKEEQEEYYRLVAEIYQEALGLESEGKSR